MKILCLPFLGKCLLKIFSALLILVLVYSCTNEKSSDSSINDQYYMGSKNENSSVKSSVKSNNYIQKETSLIKASDTLNSSNNFTFFSMKSAREIGIATFPHLQGGKIYKNQEPFGTQVNVHYDDFYKSYDIRFISEKEKLMSIEIKNSDFYSDWCFIYEGDNYQIMNLTSN